MAWISPLKVSASPKIVAGTWDELAELEARSPGLTRLPGSKKTYKVHDVREVTRPVVPVSTVKAALRDAGLSLRKRQSVMKLIAAEPAAHKTGSSKRTVCR
ncbi:hypothetical protein OpiT1DRAFT_03773 [Opitutaceae bacterium TAV1]|nr:hypothetical protein OpiT1DRAFT_03773 [Opitutaceae bacterium TAV1]